MSLARLRCTPEVAHPWIRLVTSTWTDLFSFNIYQGIFLFVFACVAVIFSFVQLGYYTNPDWYPSWSQWENDEAAGIEYWRRCLFCLSGAASFTGAMSVVMTTKGKFSCYSWGIINCITYGLFAFAYGYAGDAQLNIILFLPMQFVGMYTWKDHMDEKQTAQGRSLGVRGWLLSLVIATALAVAFYYEIPQFAIALSGEYVYMDSPTPRILDSVANALSLIAQGLLLVRFWEQWVFWITVDCIQIAMYSGVAGFGINVNVLIMWSFFLANALWGLLAWYARAHGWGQSEGDRDTFMGRFLSYLNPFEAKQPAKELELATSPTASPTATTADLPSPTPTAETELLATHATSIASPVAAVASADATATDHHEVSVAIDDATNSTTVATDNTHSGHCSGTSGGHHSDNGNNTSAHHDSSSGTTHNTDSSTSDAAAQTSAAVDYV